jgi:hypothetical protein
MDAYTEKVFFNEIEDILNCQPIDKSQPVMVYYAEDGLPELLHFSGNKMVGNILGFLEDTFGYIGESHFKENEGAQML